MFGKSLLGSIGVAFVVLVACSKNADEGRDSKNDGASGSSGAGGDETATGGDGTTAGGSSGSASGASSSGGASTRGGAPSSGGASTTGGSSPSDGGNEAGGDTGITDAGVEDAPADAASDAPEPPQCLGSGDACGEDAGTCCEAYACRDGKCCTPNGVWSNCISGSDCCSGNCVLNQCTCVPRGYSCSGAGQCCSGFACVNGTCICPPDIRGC